MKSISLVTLLSVLLVALLLVNYVLLGKPQIEESPEFFVGVDVAYANIEEIQKLIDKVSSYTNLFVIGSTGISCDEIKLDETCQYLYDKGFYFIIYKERPPRAQWLVDSKLRWGNHLLGFYAFDEAGNVQTLSVFFSIVQKIDLLIDPSYEVLDDAGNYLFYTEILNHPNFDSVGVNLNGTFQGCLEWSYFYNDYRVAIQLEIPGVWEVSIFANTTLQEYDFYYFEIEWNPTPPTFESVSIILVSSSYEVLVHMDSGSLSLEGLQIFYNDSFYDVTES